MNIRGTTQCGVEGADCRRQTYPKRKYLKTFTNLTLLFLVLALFSVSASAAKELVFTGCTGPGQCNGGVCVDIECNLNPNDCSGIRDDKITGGLCVGPNGETDLLGYCEFSNVKVGGCGPYEGCETDSDCPSINVCQTGTCIEGACVFVNNDFASCDDGQTCTTGDQCVNAQCVGTPIDCTYLDDFSCDGLVYNDITGVCVDGACTEEVTPIIDCDDSKDCSTDTCDDVLGCDYQPDPVYTPAGTCGVGACERDYVCDIQYNEVCYEGQPTPEVCDGLVDEDCDGEVDEGCECTNGETRPITCGVGACEGNTGLETCTDGVWGGNTCNPLEGAAQDDATCDGVDDDCDGLIDEDYSPIQTSCGTGYCASTGVTSCVAGQVQDSCEPGLPASDVDNVCDGIDNDCDGSTDEEYVPVDTDCGLGFCASTGVTSCVAGEVQDSCTPGQPESDIDDGCDGVDNDCDGSTDEEYTPTTTSCGVGECASTGSLVCESGSTRDTCQAGTPGPSDASCDGFDNDCDGSTDEDYTPTPTTCGVGACASNGQNICVAGDIQDTCQAGTPTSDNNCDGVDDDCDGTADEHYVDAAEYCDSSDDDLCEDDVLICLDHVETCWDEDIYDFTEVCDGFDNDCNPATIDGSEELWMGYPCDGTDSDLCEEGSWICSGGDQTCTDPNDADPDLCNGVDDDCNPATYDGEDDPLENSACDSNDVDLCTDDQYHCIGGVETCWDNDIYDFTEYCDGQDNDCNPATIDGSAEPWMGAQSPPCGVGECVNTGYYTCEDGQQTDTCTPLDGNPETCNLLDDDCDGFTDEDFTDLGESCSDGIGPCEAFGVKVCTQDGSTTECNAQAGTGGPELCDGIDNDCDGDVDEDYPTLGTECTVGQGVCENTGKYICSGLSIFTLAASPQAVGPGPVVCDASPLPGSTEICDGIDNDCDGQIDEGFPVGEGCTVGTGACENTGQYQCTQAGGYECDATPLPAGDESCNEIDDDCDESIDEDFTNKGNRCSVGTGACEGFGYYVCTQDESGTECDATEGSPGTETCSGGIDEDCDGLVDCYDLEDCEGTPICEDALCGNGVTNIGEECDDGNQDNTDACLNDCTQAICGDGYTQIGVEECDDEDPIGTGLTDSCVNCKNAVCGDGYVWSAGEEQCDDGNDIADDGCTECQYDCTSHDDCQDGLWCNGQEQCQDFACVPGTPVDCGELSDSCNEGVCNDEIDSCEADPLPDTTVCGSVSCTDECNYPHFEYFTTEGGDSMCDGEGTCVPYECTLDYEECDSNCDASCEDDLDCTDLTRCAPEQVISQTRSLVGCSENSCVCEYGEWSTGICDTECGATCGKTTQETDCACTGDEYVDYCIGGTLYDFPEYSECNDGCECSPCVPEIIEDSPNCPTYAACVYDIGDVNANEVAVPNVGGPMCLEMEGNGENECSTQDETACWCRDQDQDGYNISYAPILQPRADVYEPMCGNPDCDDLNNSINPGIIEVCNGIDDNCNDQVDEGYQIGEVCVIGIGACQNEGLFACNTQGTSSCDVEPGEPAQELCNNIDDDCDEEVDEDFPGLDDECTVGVGECKRTGNLQCTEDLSAVECSVTPGDPSEEICGDQLDNDCDGEIDETCYACVNCGYSTTRPPRLVTTTTLPPQITPTTTLRPTTTTLVGEEEIPPETEGVTTTTLVPVRPLGTPTGFFLAGNDPGLRLALFLTVAFMAILFYRAMVTEYTNT